MNSATGTRIRVARVRAEYPSQLDYSGSCRESFSIWAPQKAPVRSPHSPPADHRTSLGLHFAHGPIRALSQNAYSAAREPGTSKATA